MNSRQAKEILMRCRPDGSDPADPELAEAVEFARRDPELARWFERHCAFQNAVRDQLKQIPIPPDLKEKVLAGYPEASTVVWWRRPVFQALAAAADITLLIGLSLFRAPERGE